MKDDAYWNQQLEDAISQCQHVKESCKGCILIGKRRKPHCITDRRFDTKERCCYTRSHETGCPVSIRIKQLREQTEHDAKIRQEELVNFDRWFSGQHVCGKYAKVADVRQYVHKRIDELREEAPQ